ncbi:MAG TPA: DEDD exonuclease domain-containing protein [Pseudonocardiaceae bacterium]|jgi:DNA polymerase-3 subunit epsilon|nr:DEDD exonuclease domain-containing protein [Pseudonocardiaceae bacterium]
MTTIENAQLAFDELGTPLRETTFVVFDLETTGGSAERDAITEIGAVKVRGGAVLGEFATLVDPERGVPPEIVALTGITNAMVYGAPTMREVLPAFLEFASGAVLVAHNSAFDIGFIKAACGRLGYPWKRPPVICTVKLARRALTRQEAPSCKLSALATMFQSATRPIHRALDDAKATVDVLHGLLERVGSVGVASLEELLDFLPEVTAAQRSKRSLAMHLPNAPGVYLFRGPSEEVLYVGTASDLRRRVRQYFTASEGRARLREMVALAVRVDSVTCAHALEAEVRELRLLTAHKPTYNRRSKNAHAGWWVSLTDEAFPRFSVVRTARDGAIGPFRTQGTALTAIAALHDALPIRPCTVRIPAQGARARPCALAELGRCKAPCAGRQTPEGYAPAAETFRGLVAGAHTEPLRKLADSLIELSRQERFEMAGARRDRMVTLIRTLDRGQKLAALAALPQLVAARPRAHGGWDFAVIRHGRLACAGFSRAGVPPMPIVHALVAAAETVLPGAGPLRGAPHEEVALLARWLDQDGTRLVLTTQPWSEPIGSAGRWREWAKQAAAARPVDSLPD